jgi:hypothetical protein
MFTAAGIRPRKADIKKRSRRRPDLMAPEIRTFLVLLVALGGAASTSVEEAIQASLFASFAV